MCAGDVGLGLASMQGGKRVHGLSVRGGVHEHNVWSNKRKKPWTRAETRTSVETRTLRGEHDCRDGR
jgi:hypothetical protein